MVATAAPLVIIPIAVVTCVATLAGGLFAIAMRDRLHLILGFSAGAVLGVAFFDLMPEALAVGHDIDSRALMATVALGFFIYVLLDRATARHSHGHPVERNLRRGWIGATSLSIHSFLDGLAIGVAFQAGEAVGIVVSVAVLIHDFSDGLNTVNVVIKNGGNKRNALRWLLVDAIAPVLGALTSLALAFPDGMISVILALFAGFFLYIGASDLLPESHHAHPRFFTTLATFAGAATLYGVTQIAH
jgi:ZIP family zinc transporter